MLRSKAADSFLPHTLVMTATPIPRTLALTVFGDLDVSTITDLPPGRAPITTRLIRRDQRRDAYLEARTHLDRGNQAYIVVPAVDAETSPDLADVRSTVEQLEQGVFKGYRIAGIHGRLEAETRDHIMGRFRAGLIDVLVATTVIEVGVDVPNATAMIIEHADRFGLAQLHQIRGRIGRGAAPGLCIAISDAESADTSERLTAFASTTDGFALADTDFRLRGPGDIFSAQQSGSNALRIVSFPQDHQLLLLARRDAQHLVEHAQTLAQPDFAILRRRLAKRHGTDLALLDVA
jgi:ATP-dependent DNA helicase RecG